MIGYLITEIDDRKIWKSWNKKNSVIWHYNVELSIAQIFPFPMLEFPLSKFSTIKESSIQKQKLLPRVKYFEDYRKSYQL